MTRPFRRADSRPLFSGSFAGALEPRRLLSAESFDSIAAPADALLGPAVEFGASAYFFTRDSGVPIARAELWKSDGTPAGTVPTGVSFSVPTPDDVPASLTVMGGRLLFAATDERLGRELWVSDGTPEGTAPASDFAAPSARPGAMIVVGQQAFFALDDAATGRELWRTDGTPGGTRLVADIRPDGSSNPTLLTPFAGRLFFVADDGTHGAETWSTDGTPGGTSLLADVRPAAASAQVTTMYAGRTTKGDFLFFDADAGGTPGTGPEPWVSDGTEIGTRPLRDVLPGSKGSRPTSFAAFNGYVYFSADDGVSGRELWRTDGSAVGTARVADARPGGLSTDPKELTPLRDRLLFAATGQSGGLWSTDGTALGTRQIMPPAPDAFITLRDMRAVGDRVFFVAATQRGGEEPWVTDGTDAGTVPLRDLVPGPAGSRPLPLARAGSRLVFSATDMVHGAAPWVTDGTPGGTTMLKRVAGDVQDVRVSRIDAAGDKLFAFGTYPSPYLGTTVRALWQTDGSSAGTTMVTALPQTNFPQPDFARAAGNKLFFGGTTVWATDGTSEGTYLINGGRIPDRFANGRASQTAVVGDTFFFAIEPNSRADELWQSDGTPAGTVRVKSFGGVNERDRGAASFHPLGDRLVFWATDGEHGYEPWVSDGTEAGTTMLYDVNPGGESSALDHSPGFAFAAEAGGTLYFQASDGTHFNALWRTDGTPGGTLFVKDLVPGSTFPREARALSAADGDVLYFMAYDGPGTLGIWRTDGTDSGTRVVVGGMSSWLSGMVVWEGNLYIPFNTGTSSPALVPATMYRSDGTPGGTVPLESFVADANYSSPADPVVGPDGVYFRAFSPLGRDLWKTDGTPEGTVIAYDMPPAAIPFNLDLTPFADRMWFVFDNKVWATRTSPVVAGRHVFYNRSAADGNDPGAGPRDDSAIAPDRAALLPGGVSSRAAITNFVRGLNGIMVDVDHLPRNAALTADDFSFRRGPSQDPRTWAAGAAPVSVTVRRRAGVGGSDRVTLVWPDYDPTDPASTAVANGWLEVTVKANERTGLSSPDVFAFGNLIGETGDDGRVNALDLGAVKRLLNTDAPTESRVDFNHDGRVNALDLGIVKKYLNRTLAPAVLPPPAGPAPATVEAEGATALLLEGGQMAPWKG